MSLTGTNAIQSGVSILASLPRIPAALSKRNTTADKAAANMPELIGKFNGEKYFDVKPKPKKVLAAVYCESGEKIEWVTHGYPLYVIVRGVDKKLRRQVRDLWAEGRKRRELYPDQELDTLPETK